VFRERLRQTADAAMKAIKSDHKWSSSGDVSEWIGIQMILSSVIWLSYYVNKRVS
jgi:hypothetical protein